MPPFSSRWHDYGFQRRAKRRAFTRVVNPVEEKSEILLKARDIYQAKHGRGTQHNNDKEHNQGAGKAGIFLGGSPSTSLGDLPGRRRARSGNWLGPRRWLFLRRRQRRRGKWFG
jgi:hypothetical protein